MNVDRLPRTGRARVRAGAVACAVAAATALAGGGTAGAATPTPPAPGTPASATPSPAALSDAQARATALREQLASLRPSVAESVSRYEAAEEQLGQAVVRSVSLRQELDAARAAVEGSQDALERRLAALYRSGGPTLLVAALLRSKDPADLVSRKQNVDAIVRADVRTRTANEAARRRIAALEAQAQQLAAARTAAAVVLENEAAAVTGAFDRAREALASADAEVLRILEEQRAAAAAAAAARLRSTAGSLPGAYVGPDGACPVGPAHSFVDTWHAPRSGGRKHQGTDVFAPLGSPAYAVVDGVIDKTGNGGLGGITLWLRGENGDRYYYAHNSRNLVQVGDRVTKGQVIALVGKTGNAETTPPHIHFEAHPGGGAAQNPYPWLAALCAD